MKTNFFKKLKICKKIFLIFTLTIFFAGGYVFAETIKISDCDWAFSGQCVVKTTEIEEDDKKITRVMEIPMVEEGDTEDGRVTDSYTDSEGKKHYRMGTVNIDEEVKFTDINDWKTEEEHEEALSDLDSPSGQWTEDSNKGSTGNEKFTYTLLQELPKEGGNLKENVTLEEYLTWAFRFALALAGFLAVMMIVIGGVEYIISGANESSRSDAKKRIESAIWGLVMALVSYLVLYTINPSLVDFNNNQFFKEKETTSSDNSANGNNDSSSSDDSDRWTEESDSNIGDFNDTTTETGDIPI